MKFDFDTRASDSAFVDWVWRTQSERSGSFISTAAINWEMVVTSYNGKTTITVRGPETKARPADCPADAEFFGIVFKVGTFMPRLPAKKLLNAEQNLPEATNQSFWLDSVAWQFPSYGNADTFVDRLVRKGLLVREPVVATALMGQVQDLSLRSIQRRFVEATGMTHKTIEQIQRARHALSLLEQGVSILDAVYEAGYYDQSHLTNALTRFMGQTPAQIVQVSQSE